MLTQQNPERTVSVAAEERRWAARAKLGAWICFGGLLAFLTFLLLGAAIGLAASLFGVDSGLRWGAAGTAALDVFALAALAVAAWMFPATEPPRGGLPAQGAPAVWVCRIAMSLACLTMAAGAWYAVQSALAGRSVDRAPGWVAATRVAMQCCVALGFFALLGWLGRAGRRVPAPGVAARAQNLQFWFGGSYAVIALIEVLGPILASGGPSAVVQAMGLLAMAALVTALISGFMTASLLSAFAHAAATQEQRFTRSRWTA